MKILVSACLMGENVKYSGGNNRNEKVLELAKDNEMILVCPEMLGGLSCPRKPAEIVDGVVRNQDGNSVDDEYRLGAEKALAIAKENNIDYCILQSRSPSCGVKEIYDGSFTGKKIPGQGIFAKRMLENGYKVVDVADL